MPTMVRAGLGLKIEGPRVLSLEEMLQHELRAASVAAYLDIDDDRAGEDYARINWGMELGILEALFLRIGYVDDKSGKIEDYTYGIGLGLQVSVLAARFDYARRPLAEDLGHENKYGGALGIIF